VARIKRRRRIRCKLPCEILGSRQRRIQGRVVALSEGGLAFVSSLQREQGETVRMRIMPPGGTPVAVSAIVWNDESVGHGGTPSRLRRLGCVVSEPSRSFLALLDQFDPKGPRVEPVPIPVPRRRDLASESVEPDLPRSRELQPPPKKEPEDSLPYFRVRMKQIGGPRTRILTLRARSATQAEVMAHEELARACSDSEGWGVLHISRVANDR
jgi:hypothetical protein